MMRFNLLAGVGLIGLILGGCSSLPPPVAAGAKTAVAAKISLVTVSNPTAINGTWNEQFTVKLLNWDTRENFTATSEPGTGLVTFADLPAGTYSVRDISAKVVYLTNNVLNASYRPAGALFELVEGKVNNLGTITWTMNKADSTHAVGAYDDVKKAGSKTALSQVGLEWADVKFTTED